MSGKPSSNEKPKKAPSQDRRRFLQSALGAGLALGARGAVRASEPRPGGTARVRVGLIGTDGHTGVILESIPQLPGAELTAFAKSLPEDDVSSLKRAKAFSEKTRIYDHFDLAFRTTRACFSSLTTGGPP